MRRRFPGKNIDSLLLRSKEQINMKKRIIALILLASILCMTGCAPQPGPRDIDSLEEYSIDDLKDFF